MKSREIIVTFTFTCLQPHDYFTEVDCEKQKVIFERMFNSDDVLKTSIVVKLGEPLKGGEDECNIINIARHLKS